MPRRTRVCLVINSFVVGGGETVALDVARALDPERYDVTVLAPLEPRGEDSTMRRRFRAAGVKTATLHLGTWWNPISLLKMTMFFRRGRFDIVHGHSRFADAWAMRTAGWAGVPHLFWTRHLVFTDMSARQTGRYRDLARRVHLVQAVSDAVHRSCIENEGLPPEKVETVVNGIDTERFAPLADAQRAGIRAGLGLESGQKMLLFVGRLDPQKSPDTFLKLVWRLRENDPAVRGFVCGRGPLAGSLSDMIAEGPGGVELLGMRDDVPQLLGACDLFVSTSRNEGMPLNVMEAMAAGAPFAAPDIPQISCLLDDELKSCCLYAGHPETEAPQTLVDAWAERVAGLLADPAKLRRLGAVGRRILVESYSLDAHVARQDEIYRRYL